MAYTIAHELVTEAFSHDQRPYKVVYSVHIFLRCVSVYIEQSEGEKERPSTRQRPGYNQLLADVRDQFHAWLGKNSDWWKLNETLQVSFFANLKVFLVVITCLF